VTASVLHVVSSTTFAGIERHVVALAGLLPEHGFEATIACPKEAHQLRDRADEAGIPVLPGPGRSTSWMRTVGTLVVSRRWDVIHVHDGHSALAVAPVLPRRRPIVIRTQHFVTTASSDRSGVSSTLSRRLHRAINDRLDGYIAVSRLAAASAVDRGELGSVPVTVIPPGIESLAEPAYAQVRTERESRADGPFTVGFLGRLEPEKRVEVLIDAIPAVLEAHPATRFRLIGDGSGRADLEALVSRLGVTRAVEFPGWSGDPLGDLAQLDVYVNPWPDEGYGMAMAEAMSCGVPVIAPDAGASPELVADSHNGLLVPPVDPEALSRAISRLLANPQFRRSLGAAAVATVSTDHVQERTAAATAALYRDLIVAMDNNE